jgi:hypothetical protein
MVRAIIGVIAGVVSAFVVILVIEALGALFAPAGVAPSLKDEAAMRVYLAALPLSAHVVLLAAYLFGSMAGGVVAGRMRGKRNSRVVWVVGALVLAATVANLVMIPHPLWFSIAAVVAIFIGTALAGQVGPAAATVVRSTAG